MRYFGAIQKIGSETNILFIGALISSFLMIFILIEPLLGYFYHPKKESQGPVIRAIFTNTETKSDNQRSAQTLRGENQPTKKEDSGSKVNSESKNAITPLSSPQEITPSFTQANNSISSPSQFAFNTAPPNPSPYSDPVLGGRSGFRSKPPTTPGPQKTTDTASDQALEVYKNQIGKEVEQRHAQAELGQLMASLEMNEEYQCSIKRTQTDQQKVKKITPPPIAQCKPGSAKAAYLEWIIQRLFIEDECAKIGISKLQGISKELCSK